MIYLEITEWAGFVTTVFTLLYINHFSKGFGWLHINGPPRAMDKWVWSSWLCWIPWNLHEKIPRSSFYRSYDENGERSGRNKNHLASLYRSCTGTWWKIAWSSLKIGGTFRGFKIILQDRAKTRVLFKLELIHQCSQSVAFGTTYLN